jgi:hypothetical protein
MVYDMCMQYGVDGNQDLHLLSLLHFLFSKLKSGELRTDMILGKFGQVCINMIYVVCDHVGGSTDSKLNLEDNYLLPELNYLNRMGKHFISNEPLESEDLLLWENVKTLYFNTSTDTP